MEKVHLVVTGIMNRFIRESSSFFFFTPATVDDSDICAQMQESVTEGVWSREE